MSCSLNIFSCIHDVNRVVQLLSESTGVGDKDDDHSEDFTQEEDGWDADSEDWGWTADDTDKKPAHSSTWLQDCCISLSPSNDTMVIAKDDRAVFLASKWDSQTETKPQTKYEIVWSGTLAVEEGECVTDVLCIPLASQHRSSQGSPDWTCIIAGMTSGYMRIYLQNGSLMFSQLLHEDPVIRLKCRTWQPHRSYGKVEQVEELAILYPNALVIIDGFSMYQSLRACRNQLARAKASGMQDIVQPPPLAYKKWCFDGQRIITDIASCGVITQNLFDQLQTASFIGGYKAIIRTAAPAMSHYVTSGADPFMAVYCAVEGSSPPLISDVAMAVASKLKSAVLSKLSAASGWLGWGGQLTSQPSEPTKPVKPKVEKGTRLPARYGLPDFRRHGNSITLAPNGKVAVTTDDFGRVLLLDIKKGISIRMWKGYREAECGWIMVDEDDVTTDGSSTHAHHRTALFLVIYAAKRGILEIWRAEQGPRVAAFNIGKDCRLLYAGHGIMGLGHVIRQGQAPPQHTLNCTLIQGDGTLKAISVPFHYALSDKHSRRVRDLHLLKKLLALLECVKADDADDNRVLESVEGPVLDTLTDIRTPQLQRQGLQCLLGTVGLPGSLMLKAVSTVGETVDDIGVSSANDEDDEKEDTDSLRRFCVMQKRLLQTHSSLTNLDNDDNDQPWNGKNKQLAMAQLLGVTKSEAVDLLDSLENYWQHTRLEPTNQRTKDTNNRQLTVTTFLGCFEPVVDRSSSRSSEGTGAGGSGMNNEESVGVRKGISADMTRQLANFLFKHCLTGICGADSLNLPLESSGVEAVHLMDLLVRLWLETADLYPDTVDAMFSLHSLVSTISSMTGGVVREETGADDSSVSPWWERVRHSLAQSSSVARALALAVVCRSVALGMSTAAKKVQDADSDQYSRELGVGDWVSISVEIERWNLLVFQLSDLVMLSSYLARLPGILQQEPSSRVDSGDLSVLGLLSGGHGAAARVLARSLVRYGVPPQLLGEPRSLATRTIEPPEGEAEDDDDRPEEEEVEEVSREQLEGLNELRTRFPYSLHQDILWATCVDECATQWSADKEQTVKLVSALDYLRCIHCIAVQNGLAVLLWKKYMKDKISSMVVLMEKVGKAPKDRLCRKAVDMSYAALEEFLYVVKQLLELITQIDMSEAEVLLLRTEDFWHTGDGGGPQSIIEEAIEQPSSNVPLVELHAVLGTIMWLIIGLEMKSVKPLALFDTTSKGAFLKDLSANPILSSGVVDETITQSRKKFFTKAFSMLVSSLSSPQLTESSHAHCTQSPDDWSRTIFTLAEQLGIDADPLRRHYVCELFSAGLDSTGMEILKSVQDKQPVGSRLLSIVGQRLAYAMNSTESSTESVTQLSRLPTNISRWIKQQEPSKLACRIVPLPRTGELLSTILTLLPANSSESSLASTLSEAAGFLFQQT